jgi:signal transduction histidine kinase
VGAIWSEAMTKILVIDDDDALRELVQLALVRAGYEVEEANDGSSGVEAAMRFLPDLILCDVRMEGMDGYATLRALRKNLLTATTPVILMTGQADTAGMRQGMELGADDYLPKPFRLDELTGAVEARLRKQRTLSEQATKQLADLRANITLSLPHELLTPLNGILGFADLLASGISDLGEGEVESMAAAIRESAERLHRLIQNFLLMAQFQVQAEDSKALLRGASMMDLGVAVGRVSRSIAGRAGRAGDLVLHLAEVQASVHEEYWTKVVEELVDNAFKFSDSGQQVTVDVEEDGGWGVLRVTDCGRGMKPEHIAEVGAYMQFERRFYEQQGSGLGLVVAKRLTELHGGRLDLRSDVTRGTTVEVRIPQR